jgi:hypothetical protein
VETLFKVSENRLQLVEHSRNDIQVSGIQVLPFQSFKIIKNPRQELNRNWQTGKFQTTIHSLEFDDWNGYFDADDFRIKAGHCGYFYLDDDYILKEKREGPMMLKVLDRRTMKIQRVSI